MKNSKKLSLKNEDTDFVLDLFFTMLSELLNLSLQISNEFIDGNTIHRKDSKIFLTPGNLKKYVFTDHLSNDEKKKRREYLKTEIVDLLSRQTALLAGHRSSIEYGVKDLLKELDPGIALKKELKKSISIGPVNIPQKYIPFFIYRKVFKNMVQNFKSISSGKHSNINNRFFRPAFISGYLKSIHSDQEGQTIESSFTEKSN